MWTDIKIGLEWLAVSILWASIGVCFRLSCVIDRIKRHAGP